MTLYTRLPVSVIIFVNTRSAISVMFMTSVISVVISAISILISVISVLISATSAILAIFIIPETSAIPALSTC